MKSATYLIFLLLQHQTHVLKRFVGVGGTRGSGGWPKPVPFRKDPLPELIEPLRVLGLFEAWPVLQKKLELFASFPVRIGRFRRLEVFVGHRWGK